MKRELTSKITIEIIPVGEEKYLGERIWAINWFNYKRKRLYGLYNRLAAKHVIKVGGQLLFKGHNQQTLLGDEEFARQTLLIVTYPKIDNFLNPLGIKAFQIMSLLRVHAVKDFVFGFTRRIDDSTANTKLSEGKAYMIYHYQGAPEYNHIYDLAREQKLKIFFHGEKIAQLKRIEKGKDDVVAPFIMDGIVLFAAGHNNNFQEFVKTDAFKKICAGNKTNYVALLDRVK